MQPGRAQHPPAGWIPWRPVEPGPLLAWLPLDGGRFHEPFFEMTLSRLRRPGSRPLHTGFDRLDAPFPGLDRLPPSLFIFHVSRCGSTLLAQMLAQDPAVVVLSEPPLLDHLLQTGQDARVDPLLALYGQRRFPESRQVVVKLDSWHLAYHHRLRALYPEVPFVLLYREPAPIMASQRRQRGMHALPGVFEPSLFGFRPEDLPQPTLGVDAETTLDLYFACILGRYFEWIEAIARHDPYSLLLDFETGPEACYRSLLDFAGGSPDPRVRQAALERCVFHGKHGGLYVPEPAEGPPAPAILQQAYARLDALRRRPRQGGSRVIGA